MVDQKSVLLDYDVWRELQDIKMDCGFSSINDVIKQLILSKDKSTKFKQEVKK